MDRSNPAETRLLELIEECAEFYCSEATSAEAVLKTEAGRQIVEMGALALPTLLDEIEHFPEVCAAALRAITCEDPVPAGWENSPSSVVHCWRKWSWGNPTVTGARAS